MLKGSPNWVMLIDNAAALDLDFSGDLRHERHGTRI
jgi:hypothetical protein